MKGKKPFFTIFIPTFDKPDYVKASINILLRQTFQDFEILISDNSTTNDIEVYVKSLHNKKVHYYRTGINIQLPQNLQRSIRHSRGEYVLFLGDDDYVLFDSCLLDLHDLIQKLKVGFIRLNLIDISSDGKSLQKKILNFSSDIRISSNEKPYKIISFLDSMVVGMFTGLVVRNTKLLHQNVLDTENAAWFPFIYDTVKQYGGYFARNVYIIIHWSLPRLDYQSKAYSVTKFRLNVEPLLDYCVKHVDTEYRGIVRRSLISKYIPNIPAIKLYTNNTNCILFVFRVCQLEPLYIFNLKMWLFLISSCLLPKQSLVFIRSLQHKRIDKFITVENSAIVMKRFRFLQSKYYRFIC